MAQHRPQSPAPGPRTPGDRLRFVAGVVCGILGAALVGLGALQLAGAGSPRAPTTTGASLVLSGAILAAWAARLARRTVRLRTMEPEARSFEGATTSGGRSATVSVEPGHLVLETIEVRTWALALGAVALGVFVVATLPRGAAGATSPWLLPLLIVSAHRRVRRRYPLDAFAAAEVRARTIVLHRRGGTRPPLEIAVKSWDVPRLREALELRRGGLFEAEPPAAPPATHDEAREIAEAVTSWVPEGRGRTATLAGVGLVATSLLLGAFRELDLVHGLFAHPAWPAVAAAFLWLQDHGTRALQRHEAERLSGAAERPVTVHVRRSRGALFAWLAPWQRADVVAEGGRLVLHRRSPEGFDLCVMIGVACLGGRLVSGAWTPWWAAAYLAALFASGYPRHRDDPDEILPVQVKRLDDAGGRAALAVEDEQGARDIVLRYGSGQGPRLVALVRGTCPAAAIREPGWRHG